MITIIVPVSMVEPYLHQCIDSILGQSYTDLEVLLIDDGSPDRCGEICDEYAAKDNRVKVFHTKNRGLSAARNLGLEYARGEYIGFVDSDDWIEPDMYELLLNKMEETGAEVSICDFFRESSTIKKENHISYCIYCDKEPIEALVDGRIKNYVWNKLYRKELFDSLRFPEDKYFEDVITTLKILNSTKKVVAISSPKYHYRRRTESITHNHSAKYLIDYSNSYIDRYLYLKGERPEIVAEKQKDILKTTTVKVCRLWRWWHKCTSDEKHYYSSIIKEVKQFTRENIPLLGYPSWPIYLRLSTIFMYSDSKASFAILYCLNQLYRRIKNVEGVTT